MLREIGRTYRGLARRPAFLFAVILTMALGIGANTAIFSVIDAVLLRPLPYPGADRLVAIYESNARQRVVRGSVAPVRLEEWNRMNRTFAGIAGAYTENQADTSGALPERLVCARVSPRFFSVLATPPLLGRGFAPDEDLASGPPAAVISERLWKRRFESDPQILGRMLRFDGRGFPIVGVVPSSFRFPADDVDVWLPAQLAPVVMRMRTAHFYLAAGRIREGVAPADARSDLAAIQARLALDNPATDANWTTLVEPLKEETVGGVRRSLWILFGAVSMVLLIACGNVACLMFGQASRREREIAVRFALGARRSQVVAGLFGDAVCAALPGTVLGFLAAAWGASWFRVAASRLPRAEDIRLDWTILAFTLAATLCTALLFGLLPALHATRGGLAAAMAHGARGQVGGNQRLLRGLVSAQIALAIVLLVGAGLLIRTLDRLGRAPLGFQPDNVLTLRISATWDEKRDIRRVEQRMARTLEALASIPGVQSSALAITLPGGGEDYPRRFTIDGRESDAQGSPLFADIQTVSPDFFRLLRIPLLSGESCPNRSAEQSQAPIIVNRSFADRFFTGVNPIHQRLRFSSGSYDIIGVVSDIRDHGYARDPHPAVYFCELPGYYPDPAYLVRTAGDPASMVETVRRRMQALEPDRAVYDATPLVDRLSASLAERRFQTTLLVLFGATALLLAIVGLYGVTSFFVSERRRDLGLRAALGAQPAQLLAHVFRQGAAMTLLGLLLGLAAAAALTRFIAGLLFGIAPLDPFTFAAVPLLLAGVAAAAIWFPARRATHVNPMEALRQD